MKAKLSTDGGSRGNPGPAAYGYVLETDDGHILDARGETIAPGLLGAHVEGTYGGSFLALARSDSELLVKQMRGEYKVRNPALRELWMKACGLASRLRSVSYRAVRREHNELADRLVNDALDAAPPGG